METKLTELQLKHQFKELQLKLQQFKKQLKVSKTTNIYSG